MCPILIEEELRRAGNVRSSSGFSMRSRPVSREVVARYQLEELTLEMVVKLPEDFPLSQVTIEHDKRNVILKGMTHKLHLNLFAFINNRVSRSTASRSPGRTAPSWTGSCSGRRTWRSRWRAWRTAPSA